LLLLLPLWKFGFPVWRLPRFQWLPFACLVAGFSICAGLAAWLQRYWKSLSWLPVVTIAVFGLIFFGFIITKTDYSRAVTTTVFSLALCLVPAPYLVPASWLRGLMLGVLLTTVVAGSVVLSLGREVSSHSRELIKTEYYNLDVDTYAGAFPKPMVHGGALARIGDRYMLMTGDGHLYLFGWENRTDELKVKPLPIRVPINGEAFAAAAGRSWTIPPAEGIAEEQAPDAKREVINSEWFRTYGLLIKETGSTTRIFVSHDYWNAAGQCWVERVSTLTTDQEAIFRGEAVSGWKTLYETTPCLPVHGPQRRHGIPFVGYFGGGRMVFLDDKTLLLTVGDFGFDGLASEEATSQDPKTSYGKTIAIDIDDGHATLFTSGHRNPQGLYRAPSGAIWSTEHGPQGGDELNLLTQGANYGWPYATYGTDYGSFSWYLNRPEAEQKNFRPPVFAWVPSIAVSNLIGVERDLFPQWRGQLLIASLKAKTLFRALIRDDHVAYLEPILIGSRIRDLVEGHDGRIVLWTDDDTLVSLRPTQSGSGEALFAEKCSGCHQSKAVSGNRMGPNLSGVVGRRVASLKGYPDYSPSLRQLGGVWTRERLDAFLKSPRSVAPGTAMDFAGDADAEERAAIIHYLSTPR
jgi:cytochrome c2